MKHRRLVNLHTTGRYAGIYHIHGVESRASTPMADVEFPTPVVVQMLDGGFRECRVVRFTERTVFYQEVAA